LTVCIKASINAILPDVLLTRCYRNPVTSYRVVDSWSESDDPHAGRWVAHDRLYMIHPLRQRFFN